jgi:hypothetical protein
LAPDEPVLEIGALAPDEPVLEIGALAPDEPVLEIGALAPDRPAVGHLGPEEPPVLVGDAPSDLLPEPDPLQTPTMAELYVEQGLTERALEVYRALLLRDPEDPQILARVAELEAGDRPAEPDETQPVMGDGTGEAEPVDDPWRIEPEPLLQEVPTPFAWTESESAEAPQSPPIGEFFEQLLAWRPRERPTGRQRSAAEDRQENDRSEGQEGDSG